MNSPFPFFSELTDPRVERTKAHMLEDILFIAIASVICGAGSWNDMENFGKAKQEWLRTFLRLPGGIPSHDTFNRVFSALNPEELESSFIAWTRSVAELTGNEVISIDGKICVVPVHTDPKVSYTWSAHGLRRTILCSAS